MKDFRRLSVWEKAHRLTLRSYSATKAFPRDEMFGLTSQIRRAVAAIPANIAEGCGKNTDAEFARYLQIAFGSACELEYHILLASDLKYLEEEEYGELKVELVEVKKMLASFLAKLRS